MAKHITMIQTMIVITTEDHMKALLVNGLGLWYACSWPLWLCAWNIVPLSHEPNHQVV
jgi:hypothetical protein